MAQPVGHRIRFDVRGHFVHEAFVRERVLQLRWRAQRTGEELRLGAPRNRPLARDGALAVALAADAAGDVRGRIVRVVERRRRRRRRPRSKRRRRKPHEDAGHDVAGVSVADASAARGGPAVAVPGDDRAARVEAHALIDDERRAVVLPRHLVFARQLHANGLSDRLRHQRGVKRGGVHAVQSVTARSPHEDDANGRGLDAQHHRQVVA